MPVLAVEILSPSDVHADITEKVQEYLDVRVGAVWVIDPDFETVGVYQPSKEPSFYNRGEDLTTEPCLPGFRVRVAELFE